MSNQQQLAEHGVGFCMWGIGLISGSTALAGLASVAVVGTLFREHQRRCPRHLSKAAIARIRTMLDESGELSDDAIATAAGILAEDRGKITVDTDLLRSWEARQDFAAALYGQVFASAPPPEEDGIADILRAVIAEAFTELRKDETFNKLFTQESLAAIEGKLDTIEERLIEAATLNVADREELASLRTERKFLISIVRNFVPNAGDDFAGALASITSALSTAAKGLDLGTLPSNTGEAVDAIVAEVRRLNREGDTRAAMVKLREDTARRRADRERRVAEDTRLLDEAIAQAELVNDAEAYAEFQLEKLEFKTLSKQEAFRRLRACYGKLYGVATNTGAVFYLRVAITLARTNIESSQNTSMKAIAFNDLGGFLKERGELIGSEKGSRLLFEALHAYSEAWQASEGEKNSKQRRMIQSNISSVFHILGRRTEGQKGADLLHAAFLNLQSIIDLIPREPDPTVWVATKRTMAQILKDLAHRMGAEERPSLYQKALFLLDDALRELDSHQAPHLKALVLNTKGLVQMHFAIDDGEADAVAQLKSAAASFREAIELLDREKNSMDWAKTHGNLGNVLKHISLWSKDPDSENAFKSSLAAFEACFTVFRKDDHSIAYASTHSNLAYAKLQFSDRRGRIERRAMLTEATHHVDEALTVFDPTHTPTDYYKAMRFRKEILNKLNRLDG
ncbi:MAG: hypothetical protein AAGH70_05810 [Pseudomonadota bacterium]